MDYLSRRITAIPSATEHDKVKHITVADALEEIRSGKHAIYVEAVRKAPTAAQRRKVKTTGTCYAFCGTFSYVKTDCLIEHSGLICLDFDKVADMLTLREQIEADEHVLACFTSVSGTGLKAIVPVHPVPSTPEENRIAYESAARRWAVPADSSATDVARLCFTSFEPEVWTRGEVRPLVIDYTSTTSSREKKKIVIGHAEGRDVLPDGSQYQSLLAMAGSLRRVGASSSIIETAIKAVADKHGENIRSMDPIDEIIRDSVSWSTGRWDEHVERALRMELIVRNGTGEGENLSYLEPNRPNKPGNDDRGVVLGGKSVVLGAKNVVDGGRSVVPDVVEETLAKVESARALCGRDFPPLRWLLRNLLPEGLTLLSAKPKQGKSFLMLNIASALASGGMALSKIPVQQSTVLYINVDSSPREFRRRVMMINRDGIPDSLHIAPVWPKILEGGLDCLEAWMDGHPDTAMVVVDTLKKVREEDNPKKRAYDQDYEAITPLADFARARHGLGVVVIHHNNKTKDVDDPLDQVSGTTGLTAAADTVAVLTRLGTTYMLHVEGKEVPRTEVALSSDGKTGLWTLEGDANKFLSTSLQQQVLDALRSGLQTPKDISDLTEIAPRSVSQMLLRLMYADRVERFAYGKYRLKEIVAKSEEKYWWDD